MSVDAGGAGEQGQQSLDPNVTFASEPRKAVTLPFFEIEESGEFKADVSPALKHVSSPMAFRTERLQVVEQLVASDPLIGRVVKLDVLRGTARACDRTARSAIAALDAVPR